MTKHYALIILGAGCAGLSLARQLATQADACPSTLLLDQRQQFDNDRTWCFWQDQHSHATAMASHRWSQFVVEDGGDRLQRSCASFPYTCVTGADFYQQAQAAIANSPQPITVQLDTTVQAVERLATGQWQVQTSQGSYLADYIVDTRPLRVPDAQASLLWQSFYGVEVKLAQPLFDADVATLMAMDQCFTDGLGFLYVLPLSPQHALLEYTVFSAHVYSAEALQHHLQPALAERLGAGKYTTVRTEYGVLPMGLHQPLRATSATYVYAGLYAGGARASSGYAFQRIQRWAVACAMQLAQGQPPLPMPEDAWWLRWMDRVFLTVLRHWPAQAGHLFYRFFSRPPLPAIVHFMNDHPSWREILHIVFAMPKGLFLRGCLRVYQRGPYADPTRP